MYNLLSDLTELIGGKAYWPIVIHGDKAAYAISGCLMVGTM